MGYGDGEERIFCGFGGGLRALPFAVGACSDYRDKAAPSCARVVSGFLRVRNIEPSGVVAKNE